MADMGRGLAVSRPLAFATEEQRAVHSWSRISSAGQTVLLEALQILSPMSQDLSNTEELVAFLQELSQEGHKPTVLQSKDVYGYRSCMSQPLTEIRLKSLNDRTQKQTVKRKGKRSLTKKREVHPSWSMCEKSNPRIQGTRPPELLEEQQTVVCSKTTLQLKEASLLSQAQPCLRLTNIQGMSGFHTARLQIHTTWDSSAEPTLIPGAQQQHPPLLSGIPSQPSQGGGGAVALFSQRSLSCPVRLDGALIGDSAPVLRSNGRAFPETHTELSSNGWRGNGAHRSRRGPKEDGQRTSLRWKVIKVDNSRSVTEARKKAQKILQVNLSPVIQIQPFVFRDCRQNAPPH
ncbi:uncharacterized protein ccdc71 [Lampris incognitus]|uniref:uncharacterized protein ccdc71 n=1 Tax=Lampris incognitus TaxID=2546036 RepID=UPI0024B56182|nr:uncharacterized protein ccdc71 [Lampris incognitus]XP_056129939.1 uncharacterized protein ccdc71 [Lampris incognitus]